MPCEDNFAGQDDRECIDALVRSITPTNMRGIKRLSGGRNSRTYLVRLADTTGVVVKVYPDLQAGSFDRRAAEAAFLNFAARLGIPNIANLLATDESLNASAMSHIDGQPLQSTDTFGRDELDQMADFLRSVNRHSPALTGLMPAAESCFSIDEHLTLISQRVQRLLETTESNDWSTEVKKFLVGHLRPAWESARNRALTLSDRRGLDTSEILDSKRRRISPSDFGLHNAVRDSRGLIHFVDFEYAGVDDPAKLICDALNQPRIPIPGFLRSQAIAVLTEALHLDEFDRTRMSILRVPYMVKWACIMLNVLILRGRRSVEWGTSDDILITVEHQLDLAYRQIENVRQILREPTE